MAPKKMIIPSLSSGQLAKRWAVGVDRVKQLIDEGQLPGAFRLPSSGRYGEVVRIPMDSVEAVEDEWAVNAKRKARRRRRKSTSSLENFPELNQPHEHDGRSPSDAAD